MTVLAHAGHWYTELLYMSPVLVVAGALGLSNLRAKRRDAAGERAAAVEKDRIA